MHSVKVERIALLMAIKGNRDAHRAVFLKAQEGYRNMMIEELDRMLQDAKEGKQIRRTVSLVEPQDHTEDYDRVITMLEMSVDKEIEIDAGSFDQYVRDRWSWKQFTDSTNALYAARAIK
jgi:hypothetical protein